MKRWADTHPNAMALWWSLVFMFATWRTSVAFHDQRWGWTVMLLFSSLICLGNASRHYKRTGSDQ